MDLSHILSPISVVFHQSNGNFQAEERYRQYIAITQYLQLQHFIQARNRHFNCINILEFIGIQCFEQSIDYFQQRLKKIWGIAIDLGKIGIAGTSHKATGLGIAVHLFQLVYLAVVDPREITISDETAGNAILPALTGQGVTHLIGHTSDGAVIHVGAENVHQARSGNQHIFQHFCLIQVQDATLTTKTHKAAHIIEAVDQLQISHMTTQYGCIEQAAAESSGISVVIDLVCITATCNIASITGVRLRIDRHSLSRTKHITIVEVGAESIENVHIIEHQKVEDASASLSNLSHAAHFCQTEETASMFTSGHRAHTRNHQCSVRDFLCHLCGSISLTKHSAASHTHKTTSCLVGIQNCKVHGGFQIISGDGRLGILFHASIHPCTLHCGYCGIQHRQQIGNISRDRLNEMLQNLVQHTGVRPDLNVRCTCGVNSACKTTSILRAVNIL